MNNMDSLEILDLAVRLEVVASRIYHSLSGHFQAQPAVSEGFAKLSAEERQHAARIQMLKSEYARDPEHFGQLTNAGWALENLLVSSEQLLAQLEGPPMELDLNSVIDVMVGFEEATADLHAERLAQAAPPNTAGFFQLLAKQDRKHAAFLRDQQFT